MRKIILFLTVATLIFFLIGLVGCGVITNTTQSSESPASDNLNSTPSQEPTPSLKIYWDFWLSFNGNGAKHRTGSEYTEHLHNDNPFPYEIPTPEEIGYSNEGYTFKHWNTKADGTGKTYEPGQTVTDDAPTHLYAIWEKT